MTLLGQMGNYNVTVIHHRLQAHTLVDGRFPVVARAARQAGDVVAFFKHTSKVLAEEACSEICSKSILLQLLSPRSRFRSYPAQLLPVDSGLFRKIPGASILTDALAEYYHVRPEQVFVGVGSDDVLSMAFLTFFNSEDPILFPDVTYSFYSVWAELYRIPYRILTGLFPGHIGYCPAHIFFPAHSSPLAFLRSLSKSILLQLLSPRSRFRSSAVNWDIFMPRGRTGKRRPYGIIMQYTKPGPY